MKTLWTLALLLSCALGASMRSEPDHKSLVSNLCEPRDNCNSDEHDRCEDALNPLNYGVVLESVDNPKRFYVCIGQKNWVEVR